MSFGTLHFAEKDDWKGFIRRAKENTNEGGIHIMQFKSYVFEDEHPNVPKHLHASNKIVARKASGSSH